MSFVKVTIESDHVDGHLGGLSILLNTNDISLIGSGIRYIYQNQPYFTPSDKAAIFIRDRGPYVLTLSQTEFEKSITDAN